MNQFSEYKVMWLFTFFDLPTETKKQRKDAVKFRKNLLEDGFNMFQFSIYARHCPTRDNADVHKNRVKMFLPPEGCVGILGITDKQFGEMDIFYGKKRKESRQPIVQQLEMF